MINPHPNQVPGGMLTAALRASQRGWSVFPLAPGSKWPAIEQWPTRATTDPDRIGRYWSHPACARHGVAIACGPSGLLVIDLDQPKPGKQPADLPERWRRPGICDGADVLADLCEQAGQPFPFHTHAVRTGRGGLHLYFTQPVGADGEQLRLRNTEGDKGNGLGWLIDTRGHGGYVVAAGTIVNSRPYETIHDTTPAPVPDWLAHRLAATSAPATTAPTRPVRPSAGRRSAYLESAVRAELAHLTGAASGQHNRALFIAAQNLGQLVAGGALVEAEVFSLLLGAERQLAATCPEPHSERQAASTIRSGLAAGAKRPRTVAA